MSAPTPVVHVSIIGQTARLARFIEDACAVVDHRRQFPATKQ